MTPTTDRELLQKLELRELFVASLVGKTRQAVSAGLAEADHYFRDADLATLFNYCRVNKSGALSEIESYIAATRDEKRARDIVSAHGMFLSHDAIQNAQEIWVVLPDFRFFKASHPAQASALQERAAKDIGSFAVVTGDQRDADQFWSELPDAPKAEAMERTVVVDAVDAMPYTILLEPNSSKVQGWALVTGGFQRIDPMRTEGMRSYLTKNARSKLQTPVLAQARA